MKKHIGSLVVAAACFITAALAADDQTKKVLETLQGKWSVQSIELNGNTIANEDIKLWELKISNNSYTVKIGEKTEEGTFKIDVSKKPMTVDAFPTSGESSGQKRLGIFEFDGEKAKACFATANREVRPTKFAADEGSEQFNWIFKKE